MKATPRLPSQHQVALIMGMPSAIGPIVTDDYMFTLYRYAGDRYEGDTNGEGVDGAWTAITPNGNKA